MCSNSWYINWQKKRYRDLSQGILVKTSGSQRSLCVREPHQGARTAVRAIAEVRWWWRYVLPSIYHPPTLNPPTHPLKILLLREKTVGGNLPGSSAGESDAGTGIDQESTQGSQSSDPGSGTSSRTDLLRFSKRVEHCMHLGDLAQLKQEETACTLDILLNLLNLLNLLTLSKRTHRMHLVGFPN